eukprot:294111-Prymnesium_polylepis.1
MASTRPRQASTPRNQGSAPPWTLPLGLPAPLPPLGHGPAPNPQPARARARAPVLLQPLCVAEPCAIDPC